MYKKIRKIHFVGIGGIGMSGIAELLLNLGYQVSGSDVKDNANVQRLRAAGAVIFIGHQESNIDGADTVVYSSAVKGDNPELRAARTNRIPVAARAEMLAELMRLKYGIAVGGTHGKTTTTSLIATILAEAGHDPTVVNGGIVKALGSNARLGQGEYLVAEADESDGSFLKLPSTIAVVTNIDPEHMEHYGTFAAVKQAFVRFVERIPFYGLAVLCRDHPEVVALLPNLGDKRIVTYGFCEEADLRAVDVRQDGIITRFTVLQRERMSQEIRVLGELSLPATPGRHNIANTLAALAVALDLEIPWEVIERALANFKGVQRRFDLLLNTPERVVIDDYGHHPEEIRATLAAAREGFGERRLVVAFQPHRYSRVRDHLDGFLHAFSKADLVLVDRIYAAGESAPSGILNDGGQAVLMAGISHCSKTQARMLPGGENRLQALDALLKDGDVMIFLGAGDITSYARAFAPWSRKDQEE